MLTFKDKSGREWTVLIDGFVFHKARTEGKINLGEVFSKAFQEEGKGCPVDPAILMELCYYGCQHNSRIQSGKVDKEDFLRMLTGKTMLDAMAATAAALQECLAPPEEKEKEEGKKGEQGILLPLAPVSGGMERSC